MKKLIIISALFIIACNSELFCQDYMKMNKKNLRLEYQKKLNQIDSLIQALDITYAENHDLHSNLNKTNNDLLSILDSLKISNLKINQLKTKLLNSEKVLVAQDSLNNQKLRIFENQYLQLKDSLNFFKEITNENKQLSKLRDAKSFETFLNYFLLTAYSEKNIDSLIYVGSSKIMQFTNSDIPLGRFWNIGAECTLWSEKEQFHFNFHGSNFGFVSPNVLGLPFFEGQEPIGGFCVEASTPDGIYFKQINELPEYDGLKTSNNNYSIRNRLKDNFKVIVQIQFQYYIRKTMYFVYYKNKWMLSYIDDCDCSA